MIRHGDLLLENVWKHEDPDIMRQVVEVWRKHGGPREEAAAERLKQLVFVVKTGEGEVVGMTTAFKAYIKQLRNYFYAVRMLVVREYRDPALAPALMVATRDFLESIHRDDQPNPAIGLIALVENERLSRKRNEAIWPASKMVYIGNSGEGHPIRVYYFPGAHILP